MVSLGHSFNRVGKGTLEEGEGAAVRVALNVVTVTEGSSSVLVISHTEICGTLSSFDGFDNIWDV